MVGAETSAAILRSLPRGEPLAFYNKALFEVSALNWSRYLIQWLCYCFAFVALCCAVERLRDGEEPRPADCNNIVRERTSRFLFSAMALLGIVVFGFVTAMMLFFSVTRVEARHHIILGPNQLMVLGLFFFVLVTPVVVRFAFTVPLAVMENLPVRAALKRSDRLSDWRIMALTRLVIESEVAGFLAATFAYWIAGVVNRAKPGWLRDPYYLAVVLAGFAVAPMLIGMAVLLAQAKEDPRVNAASPATTEAAAA